MYYDPIGFERNILCFLGLYYGKEQAKWKFHKVHFSIWITFIVMLLTSLSIRLIIDITDLEIVFEVAKLLIIYINSLVKIALFKHHLPVLHSLDEEMHESIFNRQTKEQNKIILRTVVKCKIFVRCYQLIVITTFLSYNLCCIINGHGLQIPIWTPLNEDEYRIYLMAFICYAAFSPIILNPTIEGLMSFLISFMTAQIDILNHDLESAIKREFNGCFLKQEMNIQRRLRKCVIHHTAIIK